MRDNAKRLTVGLCLAFAACAGDPPMNAAPSGPQEPDAAAELDIPDASADAPRDARRDVGTTDAKPKPKPACEQNGACVDDDYCTTNEGLVYRYCHCSAAGRYGCGERTPASPSTCLQGGSCTGSGTCAVDDGLTATYCRCDANAWACTSLTLEDPGCSVSAQLCAFGGVTGATEWLRCFHRGSTAMGAICQVDGTGMQGSGTSFERVCPAKPPAPGNTCGDGTSSVACACESDDGTPCVCECMGGQWRCL